MTAKLLFCMVAGASGGHLMPGITEALNVQKKHTETEILFFTGSSPLDQSLLEKYSDRFTICTLPLMPVPGKRFWLYPLFAYRFVHSFCKSAYTLWRSKPYQVMTMGGFVSVPVCLAARLLGCEVVLFELNVVPGKAVTFLAPLAHKIFVCFEQAGKFFPAEKVEVHPYPLRFSADDKFDSNKARRQLGLDLHKKTLLLVGGSQGSHALNALIQTIVEKYPDLLKEVQIIHQTGAYEINGEKAYRWFERFYKNYGAQAVVTDFTHELHVYYSAADLVIARAGAGTLFDLEFFNKRALIIPLEHVAQGHQLDNANAMIEKNPTLFSLMRQHEAEKSPAYLYQKIIHLLGLTRN